MALDPITESILAMKEDEVSRNLRYQQAWRYYSSRAFFSTEEAENLIITDYLRKNKLYKHMRNMFGCIGRVVDIDTRFIMKTELGVSSQSDKKTANAIMKVWERSKFQAEKYKLARFGTNLGDAYIYLIQDGPGVKMFVGNSEDFTPYYEEHDATRLKCAKQSYQFIGIDGKGHSWCRIFWPDSVETYIDDRLQDQPLSFAHSFGEVPVYHIRSIDLGEKYGASSWHGVQTRLDALNEMASYMRRIIYRYADPRLLGINVQPTGTDEEGRPMIEGSASGGEEVYFLFGDDPDLKPLEYSGNILPQILAMIETIYEDIKADLPELALAQLRDQSGLSGYSVSMQLSDLEAKIAELRGNFGNGIERANAAAAKVELGSASSVESFSNTITWEGVFPEDRLSRVQAWQGERDLRIISRREILRQDGYSEEEIDRLLTEIDNDTEADLYSARLLGVNLGGIESTEGEEGADGEE